MKTVVSSATPEAIAQAAEIIRAGGLVAFPTETVYGLGANALDASAVAKIYEAKQRALNDPLIVHVAADTTVGHALRSVPFGRSATGNGEGRYGERPLQPDRHVSEQRNEESRSLQSTTRLANLSENGVVGELTAKQKEIANALVARFWPGPLTLVLPRGARVPPNVSAGLDTVAVRMPDHPVAQALIQAAGLPIAAPSANLFGHVSPTTAQHVLDDLDGRIDMLLDGGPTRIGVESTVLDLTSDPPRVLRPGGVAREALEAGLRLELAFVTTPNSNAQLKLSSPGMLDKHYAPNAQLIIATDLADLLHRQSSIVNRQLKVGLLLREHERKVCADLHPQFVLGDTMSDVARNLYAGLRALDSAGVDVILMTDVPGDGIGEAVADRLKRAPAK